MNGLLEQGLEITTLIFRQTTCATLCYMKTTKRVGVRELRQNLSVYLRVVSRGQSVEVTDRGKLVAMLVPASDVMSPLERLIASGRVIPAKGNLADLGLPPQVNLEMPVSAALEEQRSERR